MKTSKLITLLCILALLTGCTAVPIVDTPSPTLESTPEYILSLQPEVTPTPQHERRKLWDDDVYVTLPAPDSAVDVGYMRGGYTAWLVYDNYGEVVAQINYLMDYMWVSVINEKSDIFLCGSLSDVLDNIFSYETLDYAIDIEMPRTSYFGANHTWEIRGPNKNILEITGNGETQTYNLPGKGYRDDLYVNEAILYDWNSKLVLYKSGKDISNLLNFGDVFLTGGGSAILHDENTLTVIGPDGDIIGKYEIDFNGPDEAYIVTQDSGKYTICDVDGNMLSSGLGEIRYEGHDLFSLQRGNYYGVVNAQGEWLIRSLYLDVD